MTKKRIKELPTLTTADTSDLLAIVDIDEPIIENQTKKVTLGTLLSVAEGEAYFDTNYEGLLPAVYGDALTNYLIIGQDSSITNNTGVEVNSFSTTLGTNNTIENARRVFIAGSSNHLEGADSSTVIGNSCNVLGNTTLNGGIAIGNSANIINGQECIAIGNFVSSSASTANVNIGRSVQTLADYSVSIGDNITITAGSDNSVSLGSDINNSGSGSIAIGKNVEVSLNGDNGIAIGTSASVTAQGAVQLSEGQNSTLNTLQFKSNTLANEEGLYTPYTNPTNYTPVNNDNITSHLEAINTALGDIAGEPYVDINSTGVIPVSTGLNSIAIGTQTSALSQDSIAIGTNSYVQSINGVAIGVDASSVSNYSVVIGSGSYSGLDSNASVVIGSNARVEDNNTGGISIGRDTNTSGPDTIVIGTDSLVNVGSSFIGNDSIAIGSRNIITGPSQYVVGADNILDEGTTTVFPFSSSNQSFGKENVITDCRQVFIFGQQNTATGVADNTIIGEDNVVNGGQNLAGNDTNMYNNIQLGNQNSIIDTVAGDIKGGRIQIGRANQCNATNSRQTIQIGESTIINDNCLNSIALGTNAEIAADTEGAVQIGIGVNSETKTLKFRQEKIAGIYGVMLPLDSGIPSLNLDDGYVRIDNTNNSLYFRSGGLWIQAGTRNYISLNSLGSETSTNITAVVRELSLVDTTSGPVTVTSPASPQPLDTFGVSDSRKNAATNNITINFTTNNQPLHSVVENYLLDTDAAYVEFVYINPTIGWIIK
jgi:hypothetical protein